MKSIHQITQDRITELLESTGAFFAFGDRQYEEKAKKGAEYCSLGAGLCCPVDKAEYFVAEFNKITSGKIDKDLEENGKDTIIERELNNYECFYVGDIEDCIEPLMPYGITRDEIKVVYNKVKHRYFERL